MDLRDPNKLLDGTPKDYNGRKVPALAQTKPYTSSFSVFYYLNLYHVLLPLFRQQQLLSRNQRRSLPLTLQPNHQVTPPAPRPLLVQDLPPQTKAPLLLAVWTRARTVPVLLCPNHYTAHTHFYSTILQSVKCMYLLQRDRSNKPSLFATN